MLKIMVYTDCCTKDTLDPHATLTDEQFEAARELYISMLCDTARELYPDARIETAPGNGWDDRVDVFTPDEDIELEAELIDNIEAAWRSTYERWVETVSARFCSTAQSEGTVS